MNDELIGRRFGMLTVVSEENTVLDARGHRIRVLNCRCDCGGMKLVRYNNLMSGNMQSCGCTRFHKRPPADLTGRKIRMLTVISEADPRILQCGRVKRRWNYICECGNTVTVLQSKLLSPRGAKSCGYLDGGKPRIDITGQKFGKLTAVREAEPFVSPKGKTERAWLCRCECGREVVVRQDNLTRKVTRSCGCLRCVNQWQRIRKEDAPSQSLLPDDT